MPEYRKIPVVIEAIRYQPDMGNEQEILDWIEEQESHCTAVYSHDQLGFLIDTDEGQMLAQAGDWIICGVANELYPCKPDIFAATYKAVEDGTENN